MTQGIFILFLSFNGVHVPSNFEANDNARFRYQHECEAMVREWQRFGYQGQCLDVPKQ